MFPLSCRGKKKKKEEKIQPVLMIRQVVLGRADGQVVIQRLKSLYHTPPGSHTDWNEEKKEAFSLTRFTLQKMRMSRAQKKTAMTPVPMRITISTLALSLEP